MFVRDLLETKEPVYKVGDIAEYYRLHIAVKRIRWVI